MLNARNQHQAAVTSLEEAAKAAVERQSAEMGFAGMKPGSAASLQQSKASVTVKDYQDNLKDLYAARDRLEARKG